LSIRRKRWFLPPSCFDAHTLSLLNQCVLRRLLISGGQKGTFLHHVRLESDREQVEAAADVIEWLGVTGRSKELSKLLRKVLFPALLSDFLHFLYEALDASRKGKLAVCYSLLRKPLQETLFVFEKMLIDLDEFVELIKRSPEKLYLESVGGLRAQTERINKVLELLLETDRFDADYIAQLRYDKQTSDGFDGICNKAIHLLTGHASIRTEPMNITFIFSGKEEKLTQWNYLYSRLPYLLTYARLVIERLCSTFSSASPGYLSDMERRVSASILIWAGSIQEDYMHPSLAKFVEATTQRLVAQSKAGGYKDLSIRALLRMRSTGAFPGESFVRVRIRMWRYAVSARMHALLQKVERA
jgi:hypothetical protein